MMNIKRVVFTPMIALTIICGAAVLISSILLYNRELQQAMYNRIDIAEMVVEREFYNLKQNARVVALGMASNPYLVEAITENDRNRIVGMTNYLQQLTRVDFCTIIDKNGIVITRTHEPLIYGDSLGHIPHVKQALESGIRGSYVARSTTIPLGVYGGVPIYDDDMNIIGAVSLGFRLDNQIFVENLKNLTGCEVTIFMRDERIASTFVNDDGTDIIGTKVSDEVRVKVFTGENYFGRIQIFGKDALVSYIPLIGARDNVVGMVSVGYFTNQDTSKVLIFFLIGLGITLVVLLACVIIAGFISGILERRLTGMMKKVRESDEAMQKAIEEKNSMSYLRNILNGMDAMIYVTEPATGEILFMNENMKQHYGIIGDSVGQLCYKILQEGLDEICDFCPCHQLDKDPDKVVIWEEHSSKTNRMYRNVDRYISWPGRKAVHMQHSVDITELVAAKDAAEQSNRAKGVFLAQMSHEIRTPMNAILGISEIQLHDPTLTPEAEDGYRKINESGNLLLNIINDILDFSKIDAGKMEIVIDKYDIPSLLNDTVLINRMKYESKPIVFSLEVDKNTPLELIGDEMRIRQILNNLLSNAFKYTEVGEVGLYITVEPKDDDDLILVCEVSDTGLGMSKEQIAVLFDEYTRFNISKNSDVSGTGLGMNITKRLVDLMSGELFVVSEVGKGSVFTVRLPQKSCGSAVCGSEIIERLQKFSFRSTPISKKIRVIHEYMPYGRILVVDDVESNLYVARGMMAPYGLQVDTANSGFEAIEMVKNNPEYDIIFMDHMMPKMDGIEATAIIHDTGYSRPVIALTANALVGQSDVFLASGFDDFIAKPIDSRKLDVLLKTYVRDIHPPEVVEEARKNRKQVPGTVQSEQGKIDFLKVVVQDIKKAVSVLEDILPNMSSCDKADIDLFTTTVHGMKSVLMNIGEKELSAAALRLEQAGDTGSISHVSADTEVFINELKSVISEYKQDEPDNDIFVSSEDMALLKEKLLEIKAASERIKKSEAKAVLEELKNKTWSVKVKKLLDEISVYLLHGEFKKIISAIEKAI